MSYTQSQLEMKAHIEVLNAEFGMTVDTDIDYGAVHDITTVAQYEHAEAVTDYVETVKEDTGFKPRHIDFSKYTTEELRGMTHQILNQEEILDEKIKKTKARNAIEPNRPFANLKSLMAS
jgi:hypothetical protein